MLKIKEGISLLVLENYGFKWRTDDNYMVKKVHLGNDNDDKNFYQINPITRKIEFKRLDDELDDTLYDLIKDGLVEKVEE